MDDNFFYWDVRIGVSPEVVADGFDCHDIYLNELLGNIFAMYSSKDYEGWVLDSPSPYIIEELQAYKKRDFSHV